MLESLGKYLKELRILELYSQEFVASYLHIKRQTYSHYETGRIIPPVESLYHLSLLYHVSIESFFEFSKNQTIHKNPPGNFYSHPVNKLNPNELKILFYYQQLDANDKEDIMDLIKIKYQNRKKKN